ncbi:MAG: hypothetical protein U0793_02375 [Gemmataceae bacterium]
MPVYPASVPGYPGYTSAPASFPAAPPAFRPAPAVNAALATGVAPATMPAPKFRAHSADPTPPPPRLVLPTPEALGLGIASVPAAPAPPMGGIKTIDWNLTHERLKHLGAVGFHVDQPRPGLVRVTFWLPTSEAGRTQLIEASAGSEADAVDVALRQAETTRLVRK